MEKSPERLSNEVYEKRLAVLTKAVYPLLRKAQEEGPTSPIPVAPSNPNLEKENIFLDRYVKVGTPDSGKVIEIDLKEEKAREILYEYKKDLHCFGESPDGREGGSVLVWKDWAVGEKEIPIPKEEKYRVQEYKNILSELEKREELEKEYLKEKKRYSKKKDEWIDESINNWLIAAEIDLDYMTGKICITDQYEEYPREINYYMLQDVCNRYS